MGRLFNIMDTNRDGLVDEREAHANHLTCTSGNYATSTTVVDDVNKDADSMNFEGLWKDWSNSEG